MDIILVPGLWLDASSWDAIAPVLEDAGHTVHPLTMPGVGASASESAEIGIADWVDAVVAVIDTRDDPVVLVGHSGGGNVVYAAAGARPDRVVRLILLDTFPPAEGGSISEFPVVGGVIPFPGWEFFDEMDVSDIGEETRARLSPTMSSVPARVPTDPVTLGDVARRRIPTTMITNTVRPSEIAEIIEAAPVWAAELGSLDRLDVVDVRSDDEEPGHWPQFTKPERVSAAILDAVRR
ncbi:alpha/beta fold hydrolase [Microbacterium sp. SLBN-146]|uniref:alpha/beta fold hydrolase n=1 Tax=Microbacterium sp. SLBN-146 TaxID=2768457 RepID=UPI00114FAE73|nr:alpha/beta hydrolase [Microbacterium sp. SLBN-146]